MVEHRTDLMVRTMAVHHIEVVRHTGVVVYHTDFVVAVAFGLQLWASGCHKRHKTSLHPQPGFDSEDRS